MQWLKALLLSVLGFLRIKSNNAVDLRYAGAEQKARNRQRISEVKDSINSLSARGIGYENDIKKLEKQVADAKQAVKDHNAAGNNELKNKAYALYTEAQTKLDRVRADEAELRQQVTDLKAELGNLEEAAQEAENQLTQAANRQVVGRAKTSIESLHSDIKNGPLADVIEQSDFNNNKAEALRRDRMENDNSDVFAYKKQTKVDSMDDILNEAS